MRLWLSYTVVYIFKSMVKFGGASVHVAHIVIHEERWKGGWPEGRKGTSECLSDDYGKFFRDIISCCHTSRRKALLSYSSHAFIWISAPCCGIERVYNCLTFCSSCQSTKPIRYKYNHLLLSILFPINIFHIILKRECISRILSSSSRVPWHYFRRLMRLLTA